MAPDPQAALFEAVRESDLAAVKGALVRGANPRVTDGRETALHAAARRGPRAVVETLLAGGALEWVRDARGRTALDVARASRPRERAAIVDLLDRETIRDPSFRAAVAAIERGDAAKLDALLDARPALLHERIDEPAVYGSGRSTYFFRPKLVWFVANNPQRVARIAGTIVCALNVMIERGAEPEDLSYTLELTMTSSSARIDGQQVPLMRALHGAGAGVTQRHVLMAAAHRELNALHEAVRLGFAPEAALAAALGLDATLPSLLAQASPAQRTIAFALAAINGQCSAASLALDAGADIDAYLPVHAHGTALHQAVANGDLALLRLVLERGARRDVRDKLWDGTPADWARHAYNADAIALLDAR